MSALSDCPDLDFGFNPPCMRPVEARSLGTAALLRALRGAKATEVPA
jgi:hypothetical protein